MIVPALLLWLVFGYVGLTSPAQPFAADPTSPGYDQWVRILATLIVAPVSIGLGWLITRREPGNLIGPVIILWGCAASAEFHVGYLPPTLAFLSGLYLIFLANPGMFMMLANFPSGNGITAFWDRVISVFTFFVMGLFLISNLASPHPYGLQSANPFAIADLAPYSPIIASASDIALIILLLLSLGLSIYRYRQSNTAEQKQMRWLLLIGMYYAMFAALGFSLNWGAGLGPPGVTLFSILGLGAIALPSISIGAAILFHRLWDIDIIIRRTLSYALLTAVLGLIYFGGIVILQNIFDTLIGQHDTPLITVVSTLAIAALFNPLRTRIQHFIDRRFYRTKYDTEKALADFASAARDEVDINVISIRLLSVVAETVQPEEVQLLLKLPQKEK